MHEAVFFITGVLNSLFLIILFLFRKDRFSLVQKYGKLYFLLALPAIADIVLVILERADKRYIVFLVLFLVFLVIEWLYDYVLKTDFRANWLKNWKWTVPYLALYYAMNYGFIVMPWKEHISWGIPMLCLFVVQIIFNIRSHPKPRTDS